ncbi:MAG: alanine:cation symporter family protein [Thermoplasmata archaeon]|nr:alanine:cation symporter family protein [Thermoplasmata archaeon]
MILTPNTNFRMISWAAATISLFLFFFAFTSLMGEYAMSEGNIRFVKDDHKVILVLRILTILTVFGASLIDMSMMDLISDTFNVAMAITNVFVLVLLSRTVLEVYHDYLDQKRRGKEEPVFHKSALSDSEGVTEWDD